MFDPLVKWSHETHRDLPWRKKRSMYRTLVSEIMLQQTTVSTVRNHFESFLHTFPTLKSLAKAHEDCVLIAWKGLGYYRRAVNLKKACEEIEEKHGGKIPRKFSELVSLAGIGDYTANALVSMGANLRGFPVDVNMARVLSRLYGIEEKSEVALRRQLKKKFHDRTILGQVQNYRETYEAIMDLGRIYCQAKRVDCTLCPVSPSCKAHRKGNPLSYGANKKRQTFYSLDLLRVVVLHGKGFLGEKREEGQWLSGQVEVPTFIIKSEDKNLTQYDALPPEWILERP